MQYDPDTFDMMCSLPCASERDVQYSFRLWPQCRSNFDRKLVTVWPDSESGRNRATLILLKFRGWIIVLIAVDIKEIDRSPSSLYTQRVAQRNFSHDWDVLKYIICKLL